MKPHILEKINTINREFYQNFADSFAQTRKRIQPGVARILNRIPGHGNWLDIGCGNGSLAEEWMSQRHIGQYHGVDFSSGLISEAYARIAQKEHPPGLQIGFSAVDLTDPEWPAILPLKTWDGLMMFAVLHHIAGQKQREQLLRQLRGLVKVGSFVYLSVWQLRNSPRLIKRLQSWSVVGIDENELETGDVLMDWRAAAGAASLAVGLRYVHLFTVEELRTLARDCGFNVVSAFSSDGHEKNLGLYQCWQAVN